MTEESININQEQIEDQIRADTNELEDKLHEKLDIRKISGVPDSYDPNLDDFFEREENPNYGVKNNIKPMSPKVKVDENQLQKKL